MPKDLEVEIKMTGTDDGEFNYVLEEYENGEPTGRLNYYGIALTDGAEFTQSLSGSIYDNGSSVPIASADGNIEADEYLSAEDMNAFVTVTANSDAEGVVIGADTYPKGDNVELKAVVSDDNYKFNGWYIGDELVSTDETYRFTAINDVEVYAKFIRNYYMNSGYSVDVSDKYEENYSAVIYRNIDTTDGLLLTCFDENAAEEMNVLIKTYDENSGIIGENKLTAMPDEYYRYDFGNVDLTNIQKAEIYDESDTQIAVITKNPENSIYDEDGVSLNLLGKYEHSAIINAAITDGKLTVKMEMLDDTINTGNIDIYLADYDEYNVLKGVHTVSGEWIDDAFIISADLSGLNNCKLFIWDEMIPIIGAITDI